MNLSEDISKLSSLQEDKDNPPKPSGCPIFIGKTDNSNQSNLNYSSYLKLDQLLTCQVPIELKIPTHDQHLFIITHQAFELWFKQVIFEIDSIRNFFMDEVLNERHMLVINQRLFRITLIFKTMIDQFDIIETMTAQDFMNFRVALQASSGFQSLQFRLLENKLGIKESNRTRYNKASYQEAFPDPNDRERLIASIEEPNLFSLVERWLERTPGLQIKEFDFWKAYLKGVDQYIQTSFFEPMETESDEVLRKEKTKVYLSQRDNFSSVSSEESYNQSLLQGERHLSFKAFQGLMFISNYRNLPRFSPAFQMLSQLMDIDNLLVKWRNSHVVLVHGMIGSKIGTGGSSGYQYLRSTISDRYRPFLDLLNFSTFLIPAEFVPKLPEYAESILNG